MPVLRNIDGLWWEAHSPCAYKLHSRNIWLCFDAQGWFLAGRDETGTFGIDVPNRDVGSYMLALAFEDLMSA